MSKSFIAVIAPAKRLESNVSDKIKNQSIPIFMGEAEYLSKKLKKMSAKSISKLMGVSAEIGDLNYNRFAQWTSEFNQKNSDVAIMAFKGDVYRGMGADDFSQSELTYINKNLRILSGLYGLLKPLDLMMPYRLEMGTSLKITSTKKNLYQFWDTKIADALTEELGADGVLLNLASNEYFKAIPKKSFSNRIIDFKFLDLKNGEYKSIMTYSKLARGYMCRFMVKNKIKSVDDLRAFDSKNYLYREDLSSENEMVFSRDIVEL